MKLQDKTVLITGAASGLGRELAINIDCKKLVLTDINKAGLEETILLTNKTCHEYIMDCRNEQSWKDLHNYLDSLNISVDIVINNAGRNMSDINVEEVDTEDFLNIFNNNFKSTFLGSKEFLSDMKQKNTECAIINISSSFGIFASKRVSSYCASKFAISGFTQSLRQELKNTNILVSVIYPGSMPTNIAKNGLLPKGEIVTPGLMKMVENFKKNAVTKTDLAAKKILKEIEKNNPRILIGYDARIMDIIVRFFPVLYDYIMIPAANKIFKR